MKHVDVPVHGNEHEHVDEHEQEEIVHGQRRMSFDNIAVQRSARALASRK